MKTRFTKMHGAGNDFVVFDATRVALDLTPARISRIADRHRGVGCDQILVVENDDSDAADFFYRIFNADGSEVEQCGNGARAFVRYVIEHGLTDKKAIRVRTRSGLIEPRLLADDSVEVDMGAPRFDAALVPFQCQDLLAVGASLAPDYRIELTGQSVTFAVCSMGNPHAVMVVADLERAPVASVGPLLEHHVRFPQRTNVGFVQTRARDHVALRVWERGVGETLACGTGACAAVAIGIAQGRLDSPVQVDTRGGRLQISWSGRPMDSVMLSGPAVTVFEGELDLSLLD